MWIIIITSAVNVVISTKDLQELYTTGKGELGVRLQPEVVTNFIETVIVLIEAKDEITLARINALDYKALQGNLKPWYSARVDGKHRLYIDRTLDENGDVLWLEVIGIWDKNQLLR